jgi:hypothetical protein
MKVREAYAEREAARNSRTPGQWRVFSGPGAGNVGSRRTRVWTANGDHLIAECHHSKTLSVPAQQANARFIAAAPAIFDALTVVRMSAGWHYLSAETRALIEAALTQALVDPRVAARADSAAQGDLDEPV